VSELKNNKGGKDTQKEAFACSIQRRCHQDRLKWVRTKIEWRTIIGSSFCARASKFQTVTEKSLKNLYSNNINCSPSPSSPNYRTVPTRVLGVDTTDSILVQAEINQPTNQPTNHIINNEESIPPKKPNSRNEQHQLQFPNEMHRIHQGPPRLSPKHKRSIQRHEHILLRLFPCHETTQIIAQMHV